MDEIKSIRFEPILTSTHPATAPALAIYEAAFPLSEQIPRPKVEERIDQGIYRLWVGQRGEKVVFMAILYPLQDSDLVLLGYIATHPEARNQGIGSQFFNQVLETMREGDRYLLLEVEVPDEAEPMTQRRCEFYRRLGAKFLEDVRYILPPLSGESQQRCVWRSPQLIKLRP